MAKVKREPRELMVIRSEQITTNMHRVTLGGEGMRNFPLDYAGGYVKFRFFNSELEKPITRTYSIRNQRENEIDVDFVLHGENGGPASRWAISCKAGDNILVGGPGPKTMLNHDMDWFLLIGDMTALPAISVNLQQLPPNAIGYIVIEIIDESDIQLLTIPEKMEIKWLVNHNPGEEPNLLVNYVRNLTWLDGKVSAWAACEFSSMRNLRDYLRNERQLSKENLYVSSYWKYGNDEDNHRVAKREDAQSLVP